LPQIIKFTISFVGKRIHRCSYFYTNFNVQIGVINANNMNAAKPPVVGWTLLSGAIEPAPLVQTVGY
jgi:hypothetical protein